MSLFDEIQNELIGEADLSIILRKAKVLAYKLENKEFKDWVENELNGYPNKDLLPKYRKLKTIALGDFWNGVWQVKNHVIPLANISKEYRFAFSEIYVFQGIKELEAMIESIKDNNDDSLMMSIPSEFFSILHYQVFDNLQCLRAWRVLNKSQITQIIETTRDGLLSFILELADKYPQIKSDSNFGSQIPNEQISQVFNYFILGGSHSIVSSSNSTVQGDNMSVFDQRNQQVNTQYNAAGDINFSSVQNSVDFVNELKKLKVELARMAEEEIVDGEIVTDADYQLTKAIQLAEKDQPNKTSILEHLNNAKSYLEGVATLAKVAIAVGSAIAAASTLF